MTEDAQVTNDSIFTISS